MENTQSRILMVTLSGAAMKHLLLMILLLMGIDAVASGPGDSVAAGRLVRRGNFHAARLQAEVDSIVVVKKFRHMYAFGGGKLLKVYNIALGEQPVGPKHFEGDRKTPEGVYRITQKNPNSTCHKSLRISYPNDDDRRYARKYGKRTGGDVMIHGILNGEETNAAAWMKGDWTWGCIAVYNEDIEELYEFVKIGSPINIMP